MTDIAAEVVGREYTDIVFERAWLPSALPDAAPKALFRLALDRIAEDYLPVDPLRLLDLELGA